MRTVQCGVTVPRGKGCASLALRNPAQKRAAVADAAITKLVNVNGPPPVVVGAVSNSKDGRATVTAAFDADDGVGGRQCVGRAADDRIEPSASGLEGGFCDISESASRTPLMGQKRCPFPGRDAA